ncbi:hypothetical protein [Planobispora longispora]|uniref:hypothetical protein n=1 Tax=Planobispora longispora TaxID=28887 RepID=UPI001941FF68|nr:hypothetical protein [Planobispora longispora]
MRGREADLGEEHGGLDDLVDRAATAEEITYIVRDGQRAAAVVPLSLLDERVMTVTLYQSGQGELVIARGNSAWRVRPPTDTPTGIFAADARAWLDDAWRPSERGGQVRAHIDESCIRAVEWTGQGLRLRYPKISLNQAANAYIGPLSYTLSVVKGSAGDDAVGRPIEEMGITYADIDDATHDWLNENVDDWKPADPWDPFEKFPWVLVTPADQDPRADNVICSRTLTI